MMALALNGSGADRGGASARAVFASNIPTGFIDISPLKIQVNTIVPNPNPSR